MLFRSYVLTGCHKLVVTDSGDDGLQWWANPNQGSGYVLIRDMQGNMIVSFNSDFGRRLEYSFTTVEPVGVAENALSTSINIYPNPTNGKIIIEGSELENSEINVTDLLGRVMLKMKSGNNRWLKLDISEFKAGIYLLSINHNQKLITKKIVVN